MAVPTKQDEEPELNMDFLDTSGFWSNQDESTKTSTNNKILLLSKNGPLAEFLDLLHNESFVSSSAAIDFDIMDEAGWCPLTHCAFNGHSEIMVNIVAFQENKYQRDFGEERVPAPQQGDEQKDPQSASKEDESTESTKGELRWKQSMKKFLCSKLSYNGSTALHLSCARGHEAIAKLLLNKMMNEYKIPASESINAVDYDLATPLHCAVLGKHYEMTLLLLMNGAAVNKCDRHGKSPVDWAVERKLTNFLALFKEYEQSNQCRSPMRHSLDVLNDDALQTKLVESIWQEQEQKSMELSLEEMVADLDLLSDDGTAMSLFRPSPCPFGADTPSTPNVPGPGIPQQLIHGQQQHLDALPNPQHNGYAMQHHQHHHHHHPMAAVPTQYHHPHGHRFGPPGPGPFGVGPHPHGFANGWNGQFAPYGHHENGHQNHYRGHHGRHHHGFQHPHRPQHRRRPRQLLPYRETAPRHFRYNKASDGDTLSVPGTSPFGGRGHDATVRWPAMKAAPPSMSAPQSPTKKMQARRTNLGAHDGANREIDFDALDANRSHTPSDSADPLTESMWKTRCESLQKELNVERKRRQTMKQALTKQLETKQTQIHELRHRLRKMRSFLDRLPNGIKLRFYKNKENFHWNSEGEDSRSALSNADSKNTQKVMEGTPVPNKGGGQRKRMKSKSKVRAKMVRVKGKTSKMAKRQKKVSAG